MTWLLICFHLIWPDLFGFDPMLCQLCQLPCVVTFCTITYIGDLAMISPAIYYFVYSSNSRSFLFWKYGWWIYSQIPICVALDTRGLVEPARILRRGHDWVGRRSRRGRSILVDRDETLHVTSTIYILLIHIMWIVIRTYYGNLVKWTYIDSCAIA